jgi:hypothetical protein
MRYVTTAAIIGMALTLSGCASDYAYVAYNPYVVPYVADSYYRDRAYYLNQTPGYVDQFGRFHPYY